MQTDDGRSLIAHGTLYKALGRLEERGLVTSAWEEPGMVLLGGLMIAGGAAIGVRTMRRAT